MLCDANFVLVTGWSSEVVTTLSDVAETLLQVTGEGSTAVQGNTSLPARNDSAEMEYW